MKIAVNTRQRIFLPCARSKTAIEKAFRSTLALEGTARAACSANEAYLYGKLEAVGDTPRARNLMPVQLSEKAHRRSAFSAHSNI
jgi:hypothetical protein